MPSAWGMAPLLAMQLRQVFQSLLRNLWNTPPRGRCQVCCRELTLRGKRCSRASLTLLAVVSDVLVVGAGQPPGIPVGLGGGVIAGVDRESGGGGNGFWISAAGLQTELEFRILRDPGEESLQLGGGHGHGNTQTSLVCSGCAAVSSDPAVMAAP